MNKDIQSIRLFAGAIIAGSVLFAGIAVFLHKIGHAAMAPALDPVIGYAGIIVAAACISISFLLFRKKSETIGIVTRGEKLNQYRSAILVQFALLNGPSIFNIIAYLLTGNNESLIIAACCMVVMLTQFPSEEKFDRFGG